MANKKMKPVPTNVKTTDTRDWQADYKKLEAYLVSIGHGHRAIKRILEGK